MERAKEMFLQYGGNRYYMSLDGVEQIYDSYRVSKETEEQWRKEFTAQFFTRKQYGKDALRAYGVAADFLKGSDCWERFLYYPLRSDWLDDVTVLFMLRVTLGKAEEWRKHSGFSKEEAAGYMAALDGYARAVQRRADEGTMTRSEDYTMQEFSDPVYIADYLKDLRQRWAGLL